MAFSLKEFVEKIKNLGKKKSETPAAAAEPATTDAPAVEPATTEAPAATEPPKESVAAPAA